MTEKELKLYIPEECMICKNPIPNQGHFECLSCGKECLPFALNIDEVAKGKEGDMLALNVKSVCCTGDLKMINIQSTCSHDCHEKAVAKMEGEIGSYIFDFDTKGVLRKIPTRTIFEKGGLTPEEIESFPMAHPTQ